ncbi:D-beta-hydroxybutyrate dehydrogenase, mitochondrial-like [Galendromus occidentalis]|uniref:D-beta-hydroxybutyrate dehydrogenase, mitochondrial-like n=1 Tax=Galendromus occidentalis TaxID=34638 RepID=A0AAJ7L443_9ACAR|nr:D-beta-hydroxybutyrate dehydrogenase, mitochondrial-like [Galendromus occidentalis]
MEALSKLSRFQVGALSTTVLWSLYGLGLLQPVFNLIPLLVAVPTIFCLSEIIRRLVENSLGKRSVPCNGEYVLITGCGSGFGFALTKCLVDKGYHVFAGCHSPDCGGAKELELYSKRVEVIGMDVGSDESMKSAREHVEKKLGNMGQLWAIVANAGVANQGPLEWTTMSEIEHIFKVNTFGVLRTVKEFLPFVRRARGRVVVTNSLLSTIANPFVIPYSMSKAASKALVEGLQRELCDFGIYCSSIEPSYYETAMTRHRTAEDYRKKYDLIDETMREDYEGYVELCSEYFDSVSSVITSTKVEEPIDALAHAVCSVRPLPYYFVDSPCVSFLREIERHVNIEVTDAAVKCTKYLAALKKRFTSTK